jgi:hypothetical protein
MPDEGKTLCIIYKNSTNTILGARSIFISSIVANVFGLVVSILLIFGAVKDKAALLVPYIVCSVIGIVLMIILSILLFVLVPYVPAKITGGFIPLVLLALPIYFSLVVISLYKKLKVENSYPIPFAVVVS